MLDDEAPSFSADRRNLLLSVPLLAALGVQPWPSQEPLPIDSEGDDDAFVMIDGWVFRRTDLAG